MLRIGKEARRKPESTVVPTLPSPAIPTGASVPKEAVHLKGYSGGDNGVTVEKRNLTKAVS